MNNQRMKGRASHPLLATLLVTLSACGGSTGETTGGGNTGGGGTAGDGGAGGAGGGAGGGESVPACELRGQPVYGCVLSQGLPAEPTTQVTLTTTGTVTAVREPEPGEPCAVSDIENDWYQIGGSGPEVMIDLVDASGSTLTVGLAVPGFTSSSVAVGESLEIDFASANRSSPWGEDTARLRVEREGQLLAAAGLNDPIGLTLGTGQIECSDRDYCDLQHHAMTVEAPDGSSVSIPNGKTAEVGELLVTNVRYFHIYDVSGSCNFARSVEYLVGAASTP